MFIVKAAEKTLFNYFSLTFTLAHLKNMVTVLQQHIVAPPEDIVYRREKKKHKTTHKMQVYTFMWTVN